VSYSEDHLESQEFIVLNESDAWEGFLSVQRGDHFNYIFSFPMLGLSS